LFQSRHQLLGAELFQVPNQIPPGIAALKAEITWEGNDEAVSSSSPPSLFAP
jgi:hypothetical protein